tara:strand:- start:277 stop:642 length:366 start_codon:yes stop_codon:yes gene_type:complete
MTVLDLLWAQIEPTAYITRDQFARGLDEWEIEPVTINGELSFAALVRGAEFHFASFGTGARITMGMIRSRLAPIMDRHGFVTTRTPKAGADRQHRFNRAFGFQVECESEFFVHYRMDKKCQ